MDITTIKDLKNLIASNPTDITISNPDKSENLIKVKIRPLKIKGKLCYQVEEFTKTQAFHKNVTPEEFTELFPCYFENRFRQAMLRLPDEDVQILKSKKRSYFHSSKKGK